MLKLERHKAVQTCLSAQQKFGLGVLLAFAFAWGGLLPGTSQEAFAQFQFGRSASVTGGLPENVFQAPTREMRQWMLHAEKLLEEERYGEAIQFLNRILADDNDDFLYVESPENPKYFRRGIKRYAADLIGDMPRAGREALKLRVGPEAEQLLKKALEQGDLTSLARLTRQFLHTEAGYQGLFLLGSYQLQAGNPLAASQAFTKLLEVPEAVAEFEPDLSLQAAVSLYWSGSEDQAFDVLVALQVRHPQVMVAGQKVALTDRTQISTWLKSTVGQLRQGSDRTTDQWRMYRGNPSRTASASGGEMLTSPRWWIPVCNDPKLLEMVDHLREAFQENNIAALPSLHPLVVNDGQRDLVLVRTVNSLLAIDLETARRVWMVEEFRSDELTRNLLVSRHNPANFQNFQAVTGLERRLWDDATYGTLSSDGNCVYMVQDLSLSGDQQSRQTVLLLNPQQNGQFGTHEFNRLEARELRSQGKRKWIVPDERRPDDPLSDVFFLGPPLPLQGTLYVLGERQGEIRLFALDAETGRMQWTQQLAVVERDVDDNPVRRLAGVSPSYSDGVLVCPTASGAIVTVDILQRSLMWGYRYDISVGNFQSRVNSFQNARTNGRGSALDHWDDSSAVVIDGKVLLTPFESNELICLSLATGEELWNPIDREDGLYLAAIQRDRVLVVGKEAVRCVKLSDGSVAWTESLPENTCPSGRGFASDGQYFLPLSDGSLATLSLGQGKLVSVKPTRHDRPLGNLVAYHGRIISQGPDYVDCYAQLEPLAESVAASLKKNPNDASNLALEAELLWDAGKLDDAIARLRRSYELDPAPQVRELLLDAWTAGLKADFGRYSPDLEQVRKLATRTEQKVAILRAMVDGWQELGDTRQSYEACLALIDQHWDDRQLQKIDANLSVRGDRWIRARFEQLRSKASPEDLKWLDAEVAQRLQAATDSSKPELLRQFLRYFGDHPSADIAWQAFRGAVDPAADRLEAEMLLRQVVENGNQEEAAAALARLAQMYQQAGRHELAAYEYQQLRERFGDTPCLNGMTGKQLFAALPASAEEHLWLRGMENWPRGKVESKSEADRGTSYRTYALELTGSGMGVVPLIHWNPQLRTIEAVDGMGSTLWKLQLSASSSGYQYGYNPSSIKTVYHGNLLVMSLGFEVLAVDMLGAKDGKPRVLWRQNLTESIPGVSQIMNYGFRTRMARQPWGEQRHYATDSLGRPLGMIGPVTDNYVCFQRIGSVLALDPLTGETLWERRGFEPGSRIFGDDNVVIVADADAGDAVVLRAVDGEKLGPLTVPRSEQVMIECGRKMLTWNAEGNKTTIQLEDPWKSEIVWQKTFAGGAKGSRSGCAALAVMEPDGNTTVLNIATGKAEAQAKVDSDNSLTEIFLIRSDEIDMVVTNSSVGPDPKVGNVSPVPGGNNNPRITGTVHGFSRSTGKLQWSTKIEHQALVLDQPSDLPALVFVCHRYRQSQFGRGETFHAVSCLDKRTGKIVHEEEGKGGISNFSIQGNAAQKQIHIDMMQAQQARLTLTFTDEEQPSPDKNGAGSQKNE